MLGLAALLYEPHQGQVRFNGADGHSPHARQELRRRVYLLRHEIDVFADTLLENIRYGAQEATAEAVQQAAELAGLVSYANGASVPCLDELVKGGGAEGLPGQVLSLEAEIKLEMARCFLQEPPPNLNPYL